MRIIVNGEPVALDDGASVAEVVTTLSSSKGVAVAVNGEVVPRSAWGTCKLHDQDRVEVLTAAQGG